MFVRCNSSLCNQEKDGAESPLFRFLCKAQCTKLNSMALYHTYYVLVLGTRYSLTHHILRALLSTDKKPKCAAAFGAPPCPPAPPDKSKLNKFCWRELLLFPKTWLEPRAEPNPPNNAAERTGCGCGGGGCGWD